MASPWSPVPGAERPAPPPPFVVHTDRAAVHRWHGTLVGVHAALGVLFLGLMLVFAAAFRTASLAGIALMPLAVLVAGQFLQVGWHAYVWGARAAIAVPMVAGADGFTMHTIRGRLDVPWPAVASVGVRSRWFGRLLVFRIHPAAKATVLVDGTPATPRGPLRRGVLILGERGIRGDLDQVLAAVAGLSAGRVPIG